MGRKKKLFKVGNKSTGTMFGFIIGAVGLGVLASFFSSALPEDQGGAYLVLVHDFVSERLGNLAILSSFVLFAVAAHFFNSKKVKLVKTNVSIGLVLIFTALLGAFRSGSWGEFINDSLTNDFSPMGSLSILFVAFLVGLVLFLDTSIDAFILFLYTIGKGLVVFIKDYLFRELLSDKKPEKGSKDKQQVKQDNFIKDLKGQKDVQQKQGFAFSSLFGNKGNAQAANKLKPTMASVESAEKDIIMKPYSTSNPTWVYPPMSLLRDVSQQAADRGDTKMNAQKIESTLESFGIRARVGEVNNGPTVTQYALEITMGTKLSKITALSNDLALALAAPTGQIRIEAPIPGRSLVGIEIPTKRPEVVTLKKLLNDPVFKNSSDPLLVPMGLDVSGVPQAASIGKMPHGLIAGTTGSGKSVMLNAWISTILFRTKPEEVRLILVDPKRVELTLYNGIPHLMTEVIVEPDKIIKALRWTVAEMETRYKEFAKVHARNLEGFNATKGVEKKPYIIFVIDELADIMMFAPGDTEDLITRIAQMARATGIHLVLATQRPSVDVITGLMKANIPTRIAFNVSSLVDSRVVIDTPGAEKLLGKGDMLYLPPDQAKPRRIQGPYVTENEVHDLVTFLRNQTPVVHYTEEITEQHDGISGGGIRGGTATVGGGGSDQDALFNDALTLINQADKASASLLQRKLKVGYARAARLLDQLQEAGYVGPGEGSKPREILRRGAVTEETQIPEQ